MPWNGDDVVDDGGCDLIDAVAVTKQDATKDISALLNGDANEPWIPAWMSWMDSHKGGQTDETKRESKPADVCVSTFPLRQ